MSSKAQHGFTLIELSIVLAIIGLLIGGLLVGQSLLRTSQVNALATEYRIYLGAEQNFETKYNALAGDMRNATDYWGVGTACSGSAAKGTCNGDGDGVLTSGGAVSATGEMFQFWRQLALAGFIGGNFTGMAGPTSPTAGFDAIPGTNVPTSRLDKGGWSARTLGNFAGDSYYFAGNYGNVLQAGSKVAGNTTINAALTPQEAMSLDAKLDDGAPAQGSVVSNWNGNCTTATSAAVMTGTYNIADGSIDCALTFRNGF